MGEIHIQANNQRSQTNANCHTILFQSPGKISYISGSGSTTMSR